MYSIKPGRGPSAMGAIGSLIGIIFGIGWTILAFSITRHVPFPVVGIIFPLFGVIFVVMGIVQLIYNLRNTTAKNRLSTLDITTPAEESDPLNEIFGPKTSLPPAPSHQPETTEARLQGLDELRRKALISDAEYTAQRQRILGQI